MPGLDAGRRPARRRKAGLRIRRSGMPRGCPRDDGSSIRTRALGVRVGATVRDRRGITPVPHRRLRRGVGGAQCGDARPERFLAAASQAQRRPVAPRLDKPLNGDAPQRTPFVSRPKHQAEALDRPDAVGAPVVAQPIQSVATVALLPSHGWGSEGVTRSFAGTRSVLVQGESRRRCSTGARCLINAGVFGQCMPPWMSRAASAPDVRADVTARPHPASFSPTARNTSREFVAASGENLDPAPH